MQNFLMMAAGIAQTSSFRTATGDGRIGHVDVRDVAAATAETMRIVIGILCHSRTMTMPRPEGSCTKDGQGTFSGTRRRAAMPPGPIIVNILLFHALMDPSGIVPGLVVTALWFVVFWQFRAAFYGIFFTNTDSDRS